MRNSNQDVYNKRNIRRKPDFTHAGISFDEAPATIYEKVSALFSKQETDPQRLVHCCNALVRLVRKLQQCDIVPLQSWLLALRPGLFSETREVRTALLRVICKLVVTPAAVEAYLHVSLDVLTARCLDLGSVEEEEHPVKLKMLHQSERFQAVKLIHRVTELAPQLFPSTLLQPLLAIIKYRDREDRRDPLHKASLLILAELALRVPDVLAVNTGSLTVLLQSVLDGQLPAPCAEVITHVCLHLLNSPNTRSHLPPESLEYLASPLTNPVFADAEVSQSYVQASRAALLTLLRSWPGLLATSPHILVSILFVDHPDARSKLVDLFFDLFLVAKPSENATDFSTALLTVDPCAPRPDWCLADGFIVAEALDVLPARQRHRPSLLHSFQSLVLHLFCHCGLIEGLTRVLMSSKENEILAVKCAILLGEILYRGRLHLPSSLPIADSLCVPELIAESAGQEGLLWLSCFERLKERSHPRPSSLFLVNLLNQRGGKQPGVSSLDTELALSRTASVRTDSPSAWPWPEMVSLIQSRSAGRLTPEDIAFFKTLLHFFSPGNDSLDGFISQPLSWRHAADAALSACELMVRLSGLVGQADTRLMLVQILQKLSTSLQDISSPLLSFSSLDSSCARFTYLWLGSLTSSEKGEELLEMCNLKPQLFVLVEDPDKTFVVKMLLSSLDFTRDLSLSKLLLAKALTAAQADETRQWSTEFLRVLLRAEVPFFSNWGLELLVKQLYDENGVVQRTALSVLQEACELEVNLNILVRLRPAALQMGPQGATLISQLCGFDLGFRTLRDSNWLSTHFDLWRKELCFLYPQMVDEAMSEALTSWEKPPAGEDFCRPSSRGKAAPRNVALPPHLFSQLSQHKEGFCYLKDQPITRLFLAEITELDPLEEFEDLVRVKAIIWAVSHLASTSWGVSLLETAEHLLVLGTLVNLAETCTTLSVRGAAFWGVCLIASTEKGCSLLNDVGWFGVSDKVVPESVLESREVRNSSSVDSLYSRSSSDLRTPLEDSYELVVPVPPVVRKMRSASASDSQPYDLTLDNTVPSFNCTAASNRTWTAAESSRTLVAALQAGFPVTRGTSLKDIHASLNAGLSRKSDSSLSSAETLLPRPSFSRSAHGTKTMQALALPPNPLSITLSDPFQEEAVREDSAPTSGYGSRVGSLAPFPVCTDIKPEESEIRTNVLRLVGALSCQVGANKTEQLLIKAKAQHPAVFRDDPQLFQEVSSLLARFPFPRKARALIQDLFLESRLLSAL